MISLHNGGAASTSGNARLWVVLCALIIFLYLLNLSVGLWTKLLQNCYLMWGVSRNLDTAGEFKIQKVYEISCQ